MLGEQAEANMWRRLVSCNNSIPSKGEGEGDVGEVRGRNREMGGEIRGEGGL